MQKEFSEDIGHSSVLEMKKSGMDRTLQTRRKMETMKRSNTLKKVGIPFSEVQVRSTEES